MKFIKKIELINFQSHKYSSLDLDPYLNVIVGPSDSGKSSIIRGIKWVLFNEPTGDFFIREGEKECKVELTFNDGSRLARYRSRSKNSYIINYSNGEELVLNGFGTGVPKEVEELTGVKKIPFDQSSSQIINMSDQLDGPFLLSEKNSTKAFVIGGLAGVDIVDDAIGDLLKELRSLNMESKRIDDEICSIDKKLESFDSLEDSKKLYENLSSIYDSILSKNEESDKLKSLSKTYKNLLTNKEEINSLLDRLKNINYVNEAYIQLYEDVSLYKNYNRLKGSFGHIANEKYTTKSNLDKLKYLNILLDTRDALGNKILDYKSIYNNYLKYQTLVKDRLKLEKYLVKDEDLLSIAKYMSSIEKLNIKVREIKTVKDNYIDISKRLDIGNDYIKHFHKIEEAESLNKDLVSYISKYNRLMELRNNYTLIKNEEERLSNDMEKIKDDKDNKLKEYQDILLKSKVCPTCFSRIDEDVVDNIVNEFNK